MRSPKVLVVAQAFKGTLSPAQVADAMREGVLAVGARCNAILASDGGDGLLEALQPELARIETRRVSGPDGSPVEASTGWLRDGAAVIESRMACGISLLKSGELDPGIKTTRGVGELIRGAIDAGASHLVVGLGGSATMDGGTGCATALGWRFLDAQGTPCPPGGEGLLRLHEVREGPALTVPLIVLCDVNNPLLGPRGARVFAAQKGADRDQEERLSRALERLAELTDPNLALLPGTGAAGGLGFGLSCFAGGELRPGADWMLQRKGFEAALADADIVITGEGAFDSTTGSGKLVGTVLRRSVDAGRIAILLSPRVEGATPDGVVVSTGNGHWDASEISRRTREACTTAIRLLGE